MASSKGDWALELASSASELKEEEATERSAELRIVGGARRAAPPR